IENARLSEERVHTERLAAIGEATAGISHCMKNILVGIKGGGEFIDLGLGNSDLERVRKGWGLVRGASQRIEDLVMNLMSFSRESEPVLAPAGLESLVGEVVDVTRGRAEKSGVDLVCRYGDVGIVHVDSRAIFRVVLNLVGNAIDACEEEGGQVTIETRRDDDGCYVTVSDTGPGIAPEVRDRLFQAFVSTKGSSGTGLGLACSDRIVRAHGGEIWVDSAPGEGATFTVFLPDRKPEDARDDA
ncbi:MAG: HAMP domain-containing histidine kinase, partial [Candidatus Hydrogenedentes bacterium]|nr:HAMP domain-containing histidine kinase [Candidatus Hydrogenedentota bacterium]